VTREQRIDLAAMVALLVVGSAITIVWGERIGIHGGDGWDGQAYAAWARSFEREVLDKGVTQFQAGRVLPSAIVYYVMGGLGLSRAGANVLVAFQILNALTLVVSAVLLVRIGGLLRWSRPALWAAFAATFLGFANARYALYYPAETDPLAHLLAMLAVWAFLARRPLVLWLAILAAAFTWPALLALGFLVLVLPRAPDPLPPTTGRWHRPLALAIGAGTAAFIVAWFAYALAHPVHPGGWTGAPSFLAYSHRSLWELAIACVVIPSALAAYLVAREDRTFSVRPYLRQIGWRRLALGVAGVIAIVLIDRWWTARVGRGAAGFTWRDLRNYYAVNAVRGPLWSLVHQVVYFGPIVLVAWAAWPRIARTAAAWGPGAVLALGVVVLTAVNADGRHLVHLMPFVIAATITATAAAWTRERVIGFALLGVGWSKLWWRIGYDQVHKSREWPDLRWFMHHGPWASDETFLWHLGGVVITAVALWLLFRGTRAPRP